jgi:hypothetical protein
VHDSPLKMTSAEVLGWFKLSVPPEVEGAVYDLRSLLDF